MVQYFKLNGVEGLDKALKSAIGMRAVKERVKTNTQELANATQARMARSYRHGFSTGETARGTLPLLSPDGLTGAVRPPTEYFVYLEHGTRFMPAMPTLRPSWLQQRTKFIADLNRLVK